MTGGGVPVDDDVSDNDEEQNVEEKEAAPAQLQPTLRRARADARASAFGNFADQMVAKAGQVESILRVENAAPNPAPEQEEMLEEGEALTPDQEQVGVAFQSNQVAGDTHGLDDEEVSMAALNRSSVKLYADRAKVTDEKLEEKVNKDLASMPERVASFGDPADIMSDIQYELYEKHFMENPFGKLKELFKEHTAGSAFSKVKDLVKDNKHDYEKVQSMLVFMIHGARRECLEKRQEGVEIPADVMAKVMALEKVSRVLRSMQLLDKNNCRFTPAQMAKNMAEISAIIQKTNMSENEKNAFIGVVDSVLRNNLYNAGEKGKYKFDTTVKDLSATTDLSKKRKFLNYVLPRNADSLNRVVKISHSDNGQVVHLGFTFDREKVLKGDKTEMRKMHQQVKDSLFITINQYDKGSESNPIVITYRPETIKQPEVACALLENLKQAAIIQQRDFFVADPEDPSKSIKISSEKSYSPEEQRCLSHYQQQTPTGSKKPWGEIDRKDMNDLAKSNNEALAKFVEKSDKQKGEILDSVAKDLPKKVSNKYN